MTATPEPKLERKPQHRPAARQTFRALLRASRGLALGAGLVASTLGAPAARAEVKDRIAATVNGQPITLSDVVDRVQAELNRLGTSNLAGAELEQARTKLLKEGLEQLINDRLIEAEAVQVGVDVSEDEVSNQLKALAKQNNLEVDAFREALAQQGTDIEFVRDVLRRQALQFRLLQYKIKPRKVTDEEVQAAYSAQNIDLEYEYKLRNIFIPTPEGSTSAQKAAAAEKAQLAAGRIAKGEEFALVARDLSSAPSAHEGGDIGWLRKGMLFIEADQAIAALRPGQNTPLFVNKDGFHLFHLDERRSLPPPPLAEVQEKIRTRLSEDSVYKERDNYLRTLRKGAQLEIKL
jgi:peptidyl-prolyl cis-trans isomerase SurA